MSRVPLRALLSAGRAPDSVVAFDDGAVVCFGAFRDAVAGVCRHAPAGPRVALACADGYRFAVGLFGLLQAGLEVVLPGNPAAAEGLAVLDDAALAAMPADTRALPPIDEGAGVVFHTSGSTARPKAVRRSLTALDREVAVLEGEWGARLGDDPVLATVGHQHLYGLMFRILWPVSAGRPFEGRTHAVWETLLAALPKRAVVVSSPAHLGRMGGLAAAGGDRRVGMVFSAGAPLAVTASCQAESVLGCRPTEIFGSTETGAIATREQRTGEEDWRLLAGHRLEPDAAGGLRVFSPYTGTVVATGDAVEARPGGFRFLGRADGVVKVEGRRVSLVEVEAALCGHPLVAQAAAVMTDASRLGAVAVLHPPGRAMLAEMGPFRFGRRLARDLALPPAARPKAWRFVAALPEQGLGKRRRADLAALFEKPAEPAPAATAIERVSDDVVTVWLGLAEGDAAFAGHFPAMPVLPGVVQVDWAVRLGAALLQTGCAVATDFQVKFKRIIRPGAALELRLRADRAAGTLLFEYRQEGESASQGRIVLAATG